MKITFRLPVQQQYGYIECEAESLVSMPDGKELLEAYNRMYNDINPASAQPAKPAQPAQSKNQREAAEAKPGVLCPECQMAMEKKKTKAGKDFYKCPACEVAGSINKDGSFFKWDKK